MIKRVFILLVIVLALAAQMVDAQSVSMKNFYINWQKSFNHSNIFKSKCDCKGIDNIDSSIYADYIEFGNETYQVNSDAQWMYSQLMNLPVEKKSCILNEIRKIDTEIINSNIEINLPFSISDLVFATSAFNYSYTDNSYSYGYFALPYFVAISYNLRIDSVYDERMNIAKSSYASSQYLNKLYDSFGAWSLVIYAYANSPTKLNKLIDNKKLANSELSVFDALIACMLFANTYQECLKQNDDSFKQIDTVLINSKLHLGQISEFLNIPIQQLKQNNPEIIGDIIYGNLKTYKINILREYSERFNFAIDSIVSFKDSIFFPPISEKSKPKNIGKSVVNYGEDYEKITYTIQSGDNLGSIAQKFNVKVSEIQDWNDIYGTNIIAGKTLIIYQKKNSLSSNVANSTSAKASEKPTLVIPKELVLIDTYEVKKGDSPYIIAKNYHGVSPENIMEWNGIENPSKIQVGQKLKIYGKK